MTTGNLYRCLHGTGSNCDEDFLTEGLVHLLQELGNREEQAFDYVVRFLVGAPVSAEAWGYADTELVTQLSTSYGVPDICITGHGVVALVEVKVDSDFHGEEGTERWQPAKYRSYLNEFAQQSGGPVTRLYTLTRQTVQDKSVDGGVRWNQLGDLLESLVLKDPVTVYLRDQYVGFLRIRGVVSMKVDYELVKGVGALRALLSMIEECLPDTSFGSYNNAAGGNWHGFRKKKLGGGEASLFVGCYLNQPHMVWVNSEGPNIDASASPEIGEIKDGLWQFGLDLGSESTHFFARSKDSQKQCMLEFLRKAISYGEAFVAEQTVGKRDEH